VLTGWLFRPEIDVVEVPPSAYEQRLYVEVSQALEVNIDSRAIPLRNRKKRLAFVSPLPPLRSGISDYSVDLLPLLAEHYEIDVVVEQDEVSTPWVVEHCTIRSASWFKAHAADYDRVMYHFGNSPFHSYMFDLIEFIPGIVVLHDFFLGDVVHYRYESIFADYLYQCHGYNAVAELFSGQSREELIWRYPLNFSVLRHALRVVVHSSYNQGLARSFYGDYFANDWAAIPLLRTARRKLGREEARHTLGFKSNDFVVCCLGMTGPIKLNHETVKAWLSSSLASDERCILVFVGENNQGDYGETLLSLIEQANLGERIRFSGWVDEDHFHNYLAAADLGVQLRTRSRGETSAAVLDCLNYGLPTIINANGAMADFPDDAVYKLEDDFSLNQLSDALECLWENAALREQLSYHARTLVSMFHDPALCASQYVSTLESAYSGSQCHLSSIITALRHSQRMDVSEGALRALIHDIAPFHPPLVRQKQLLIDVSAIATLDIKTGIQRVVRAQLEILLHSPPKGFRVEPVILSNEGNKWHYVYARNWTTQFLSSGTELLNTEDLPVDFFCDDILFCADLVSGRVVPAARDALLFQNLMSAGVDVYFQVFDILPISHPQWFLSATKDNHTEWAEVVANSCGALCISEAVAGEFRLWMKHLDSHLLSPDAVRSFHLGADIDTSSPSFGLPDNSSEVLESLAVIPSFLLVGTLEPRKGHLQTLAAFEQLWQRGVNVNLVIVGKEGWFSDGLVKRLRNHAERNQRLFWLEGISDEYLGLVYVQCQCLIAASEGEGFGLPLIEAAQHELAIIARDIPVFREVAGEFATYFNGMSADALSTAVEDWLKLDAQGLAPSSKGMPWLTWRQSTENLIHLLGLELSD